jgi:uncharacterized membrane protein
MKAFRVIHVFSLLSFLGVLVHSVMSGSDSSLTSVLLLYAGTFLAFIFLMLYWTYISIQKNRQKKLATVKVEDTKPSQQVVSSYNRR